MTPKQRKCIVELLRSPTMEQAAKEAGVAYSSVRRWIKEDQEFKGAYQEATAQIVEDAAMQARQGLTEAVATLRMIVSNAETAPTVKVSAARVLLECGTRLIEIADFEARLTSLEKSMEDNDQ